MMKQRGFTLIEVMAVVVIFLLLAALAYPSLVAYVIKARRIEGQVALLETLQKQERYFSQHNTYVAFSADSGEQLFKWYSGNTAPVSAYELRGEACPGQSIRQCIDIQAIPGTAKVDAEFVDRDCETLSLDSTGRQRASGNAEKCWP